jgi:light-regulated signal transduction histidine kinase (bacteriophytochrome)
MLAIIYKPLLYCYIIGGAFAPAKPVVKAFHPIHVSTTNIEYNKQDNKLEVICTIFTDDFEAALAKQYKTKTDLTKAEMHAAMEALVKKYISSNLQLKTGDSPVTLNFLGFEINREATDVYLESDKTIPVKKIEVNVSLLHNLFDDQINIVHITVNGVRKSEKLDYPNKRVEQVF